MYQVRLIAKPTYCLFEIPGKPEEEYRRQLGSFGVSGELALRPIDSLSGGQKSRVAFAILGMLRYMMQEILQSCLNSIYSSLTFCFNPYVPAEKERVISLIPIYFYSFYSWFSNVAHL